VAPKFQPEKVWQPLPQPGFGKTPKMKGDDRGAFLESVIKKLCSKNEKVVLVTPANSGLFSLPLIKKNQAKYGLTTISKTTLGSMTLGIISLSMTTNSSNQSQLCTDIYQ